jgi:AcrR family transcriptional regulator
MVNWRSEGRKVVVADSRRRRSKETRAAEIVEAAREAFTEKGFAATRTDDIAARAGVSKGLIFVYFPTKEALFEAVVRSRILPVFDNVADALSSDRATPAPAQLRLVLETLYRELVYTDRKRLLHLIIAEGPRFPPIAEFYHREVLSKGRALLRTIIERGVARGEFKSTGLERHPEILIAPALVAALWILLFSDVEPLDLAAYFDLHVSATLGALKV